MSEGLGLNKPERRKQEQLQRELAAKAPRLEAEFPYTRIEFDPAFFGLEDESEQAAGAG